VDDHQKEKERKKVDRFLISPQFSSVNNPEEATKLKLCVNTEDTSSGSTAAQNKITAPTEEAMDSDLPSSKAKAMAEQNLGSIYIDLDEIAAVKPTGRGAKRNSRPEQQNVSTPKPKRGAATKRVAKKDEKTQ